MFGWAMASIVSHHEVLLGPLWGSLGISWLSWGPLGPLRAILAPLAGVLGLFGRVLAVPGGLLGPSWRGLGLSWSCLGAVFKASWEPLGQFLGQLG